MTGWYIIFTQMEQFWQQNTEERSKYRIQFKIKALVRENMNFLG